MKNIFIKNERYTFPSLLTMKLVLKDEEFTTDTIYWLISGKTGNTYQYLLLGRWSKSAGFEFNHKIAKRGYIYIEDISDVLENIR